MRALGALRAARVEEPGRRLDGVGHASEVAARTPASRFHATQSMPAWSMIFEKPPPSLPCITHWLPSASTNFVGGVAEVVDLAGGDLRRDGRRRDRLVRLVEVHVERAALAGGRCRPSSARAACRRRWRPGRTRGPRSNWNGTAGVDHGTGVVDLDDADRLRIERRSTGAGGGHRLGEVDLLFDDLVGAADAVGEHRQRDAIVPARRSTTGSTNRGHR